MSDLMTVRGPVVPEDIGVTLMHEHLFINLMREYRGDGLLSDDGLAVVECRGFMDVGGRDHRRLHQREYGPGPGAAPSRGGADRAQHRHGQWSLSRALPGHGLARRALGR